MRYFRFLNRFCKHSKVEGFSRGPEDACLADQEGKQTGGDAIGGPQVGRTLAPAIEDQQLMPEPRGFGNHGTESPGACQAGHGDDHMNEKEDEVAHPGHGNNTLQAHSSRPVLAIRHGQVSEVTYRNPKFRGEDSAVRSR